MLSCISCNKELLEGAKFCKYCGANQSQPKIEVAQSTTTSCSACGTPLVLGAKFCRSCGTSATLPPPQPATKQPALEPKPAIVQSAPSIPSEPIPGKVKTHATKTIIRVVIAVIIATVIGVGGYYGWKSTQGEDIAQVVKPVLENSLATEKVQSILKSLNNQYIAAESCYVTFAMLDGQKYTFCEKLIETQVVNEGSNSFIYATLSGFALNDDLTRADYHAASGVIELFKFNEVNGKLQYVSGSGDIFSGSYGDPGTAKIIPLGKERYGWKIIDGYAGHGEISARLMLYAPFKNGDLGIKNIGTIPIDYDTTGTCEDSDKSCSAKDITAVVRQQKNDEGYYPLKLSISIKQGAKSNMNSTTQEFKLEFDKKASSYRIPAFYIDLLK